MDTSPTVCRSAASALHTLTSKGGDQAIKLATEHDILTPLIALLKTIPSQWKPHVDPKDKIDTATATFIETVSLLNILAESSALAVDRLHRENIVTTLIAYLDFKTYGTDVSTTVAQLLSTITEDQGDTDYAQLLKKEIMSKIIDVKETSLLLKTFSIMILLNINNQLLNQGILFYIKQ